MSEPATANVGLSRRKILIGGALIAVVANLRAVGMAATDNN